MRSPLLATTIVTALLMAACGRGEVVFETDNIANPQSSMPSVPSMPDGGDIPGSLADDAGNDPIPVFEFDLDRPRGAPPQPGCEADTCPSAGDPTCSAFTPYRNFAGDCVQCLGSETCLADFGPDRAVCKDTECRACSADNECPEDWECRQDTCIWPCESDHDCMGWLCDDGECTTGTLSPPGSQP